ncbi:MAG: RNA-binding protein [Mucilaginibacter sp.]|jgi:predicted nucleic acid-binding Zn ribbon protein|nr:RNA-binding protein [Mucilaginibacter sp.]MDB5288372.1 RNA-binding protein [Mucilaginibacter sp.]
MRKTNDKSLKEAIEQMLNVYKIKRRYDETAIVSLWPDLVGKSVANRTKELFIRDKKLFLRIESSVIKNELVLMRSQIIQKINEDAKTELVAEIVFL